MQEGLDTALVLPDVGEKPSIQYRTSPYTVREYCALPYALRRAVDAACDEAAGLHYTRHTDESNPQPYTIGRATRPGVKGVKGAPAAPFPQLNPSVETSPALDMNVGALAASELQGCSETRHPLSLPTTSTTTSHMITTVHPAPSAALHTLNTPEAIHHHAAHADSLATSAVLTSVRNSDTAPFEEQAHGDHALTPDAMAHALGDAARPAPAPDFAALAQATALAATPPAPAAPLAHDGTVYETTDYDRFHLLPENRDIDPGQVRKLVGMIQKSNLLHLRPVDVTPEMGIIDGQHRWAAAKELGLPIFYRVGQQLSEADITTLNTASKNWAGTDWLKYWAVKRKPAYVALADFMQRHPRISFSNARIMLTGSGGGSGKADGFRAGLWDGADDEAVVLADQVADLVERIAAEVPSFKAPFHTGFVTTVYHCFAEVEGFDAKEMLRTIHVQPRSLVTCASQKQWLEMLAELYNYGKREANRLDFKIR